jgi:phytoene desaturase
VSRVVVVGAGMGGLAVAARLAAVGHDVTVLEQSPTYGGKLAGYRRDGFVFDTGPSLLTLPAVYRDLFMKTARSRRGATLEEHVTLRAVDPAFDYRFADGSAVSLPNASRAGAAAALDAALGAPSGREWTAVVDRGGLVWQATRESFLGRDRGRPLQMLRRSSLLRDIRAVAPLTTLRGLGRSMLTDPRLRLVLDRYATYTGSDPRRAPAALCAIPYLEQTFGAWHVEGGLFRLADATYDRCLERGVTFRFDSPVVELAVEGGRAAAAVLSDGERVAADVVVSGADASTVLGPMLPPGTRGRGVRRPDPADTSMSGWTLLLALSGRTPGLAHHTVFFPADYDAEFDAVFGRLSRPVPEPAVYVCAPDDPAMRPDDGSETLSVMVDAPRHSADADGVDWDRSGLADAYAEHVLDVLAVRGLDVRDRVLWRVVRTPADIERDTWSPGGSIYGFASHGLGAAFRRPGNTGPVPGLFLVGGSVHPGGGLPLVALSAEIVAGLVGPA